MITGRNDEKKEATATRTKAEQILKCMSPVIFTTVSAFHPRAAAQKAMKQRHESYLYFV